MTISREELDTLDFSDIATGEKHTPVHPGEILREEFLVPLELSAHALAQKLRVPGTRISEIINERRAVSADTALRLARYFGTSAEFWLNLQSSYDLARARLELAERIKQEVAPRAA
jgi:addiction module HigA family antidote